MNVSNTKARVNVAFDFSVLFEDEIFSTWYGDWDWTAAGRLSLN